MRSNLSAAIAAGWILAFSAHAAMANTIFDITTPLDAYSGTLVVDVQNGTVVSADVNVPGQSPDFTNFFFFQQSGSSATVKFANGTSSPASAFAFTIFDGGSLVGFNGGSMVGTLGGNCDLGTGVCGGFVNEGLGTLTAEVAATPLPATLPLFATGLGALGLLGWRRKRRAVALG